MPIKEINNMTAMNIIKLLKHYLLLSILLVTATPSLSSTVQVFNGRGLIGVLGSYSTSVTHVTDAPAGEPNGNFYYVQLYNFYNNAINICAEGSGILMSIDGVRGVPVGDSEIMLVPEFTFVDDRVVPATNVYIDTVTGHFNGWGSETNQRLGIGDCLWSPYQTTPRTGSIRHKVRATGRLLVYGTGKQKSGTYNLLQDIGISIQNPRAGTVSAQLVSKDEPIEIIVSGLTCTLNTPTYVNFGAQSSGDYYEELLASVTNNMNVTCNQNKNPSNATIAISANVKPQYYAGNLFDVNLLDSKNKPGAFVRLFAKKGSNNIAIPLDQTPIDLSTISSNQPTASFNNEIVYELYSYGQGATGKVSGSVELSIIMR